MANYCGKCGSKLNIKDGLCPKCDAREIRLEKWRFFIAGILLLTAIVIVYFTFFSRTPGKALPSEKSAFVQKSDSREIVVSEEVPAVDTKQMAKITAYRSGEIGTVTTFSYNDHGSLDRVCTENWYNGEINNSIDTLYLYDDAGRLVAKKEADIPYNDIDYIYDGVVRTGFIKNEYWDYGDGHVELGNSVEYFFERDADGNVVKLYTDPLSFGVWTTGEYAYDSEGRVITAYEKEQYGDHKFTKKYTMDYSYRGIIIAYCDVTLNGDSYTDSRILLDDISCGPVYLDVMIPEDGKVNVDADGYIESITDTAGSIAYEFEYI